MNLDAIGTVAGPVERSWSARDTMLYAVGVGAGYPDPGEELAFTTENSAGVEPRVLPTFALLFTAEGPLDLGVVGPHDPAMVVHGEQRIEWFQPLRPDGRVLLTGRIVDILDKRSGALVVTETTASDPESGAAVLRTRTGVFIRGAGGFDTRPPAAAPAVPPAPAVLPAPPVPAGRAPDHSVTYQTLPNQALLYRLSGDRNPLHSDPVFAANGGYDRPILHGLCTYGYTCRALLHTLCGSDPSRLRSMYGRFSRPVLPGQALTIDIWVDDPDPDADGGAATFRTTADGTAVLERGRCTFTAASA
ncbi:MaoC/PaaZ C-terminal domain-containing protein [Parafrankia sp. EUN1f]|uniref:MaoC/PaaZ C-terminal domain-containing protein n=1 Tax=Parafrankia sp. EUN1f TaxID=102897 RepID=UPI0001C46252|nr:MaoC/PaaZ C-terminal domain-containing protein [Parafrankia sp. EUN1f]EFC86369.1 3-alpha,7-alpha,12-alpha-trihydroxy-5-beta-cholest-24-enoyl-CoAhydratase [Parafrankia sp. EUN1f]